MSNFSYGSLNICSELKKLGIKVPKHKNFSKQEKSRNVSKNKYFGVSLSQQEFVEASDWPLPKFLYIITTYLLMFSKNVGLFRKAGAVSRQRNLRSQLEEESSLEKADPNDVAALLKQWLRELPEPVIPHYLQNIFSRCQNLDLKENRSTSILLSCLLLSPCHLGTLRHLLIYLAQVAAQSHVNKMDIQNLALIMAPNIFVPANKVANKNSNNLVQTHTAIMQFLIENADKVGLVPLGVTLDRKSSTDIDSSWDLLDCSPSWGRKKQRGGGVPDILNGFRKLVTNSTAGCKTPETFCDTPRRLSQKHKAQFQESLLQTKRHAPSTAQTDSDCTTLMDTDSHCKVLPSHENTVNGHSRRKSFGLLRKKRAKAQTKCSAHQIEFDCNKDMSQAGHINSNDVVTFKNLEDEVISSSSSLIISHPITRSESIKKSASDSLLLPLKQEHIKASNSQSCLNEISPLNPSSFMKGLGSLYIEIQKTLEIREKAKSMHLLERGATTLGSPSFFNNDTFHKCKSPSSNEVQLDNGSDSFKKPHFNKLLLDEDKNQSDKHENMSSQSTFRRSSKKSNKLRASTRNKNKNAITITNVQNDSILDSPEIDNDTLKRKGFKRQDGFIMKSIRSKPVNTRENLKNNEIQVSSKTTRSKSELREKDESVQTGNRKTSRKGSIIRGKPNSIKSGYTESCTRFICTPSTPLCPENSTDISLSCHMGGLNLSTNELCSCSFNSSTPMKEITNDSKKFQKTAVCEKRQHSRTLSNSDSKIPKLLPRASLKIKRVNSSSNAKLVKSASFDSKKCRELYNKNDSPVQKIISISKIPIKTPPSPLDKYRCDTFSDSTPEVFKTPLLYNRISPNWTSASKFFGSPFPNDPETINKRESIAMILKKNLGHVQAKVSLYDNIAKVKVTGTQSLSIVSTSAKEKAIRTYSETQGTSIGESNQSDFKRTPGTRLSLKVKRNINSQLPPPPKFIITDADTPSPAAIIADKGVKYTLNKNDENVCGIENISPRKKQGTPISKRNTDSLKMNFVLKEVTNISLPIDDSPIKEAFSIKNMSNVSARDENRSITPRQRTSKRKNNSFSGHTCHKVSKMVLRSESSPMLIRSRLKRKDLPIEIKTESILT